MKETLENVVPLRVTDLTPELLLRYALEDKDTKGMKSAFLVLTDDAGQRIIYSTALTAREASFISKIVENLCLQIFRGELITEG